MLSKTAMILTIISIGFIVGGCNMPHWTDIPLKLYPADWQGVESVEVLAVCLVFSESLERIVRIEEAGSYWRVEDVFRQKILDAMRARTSLPVKVVDGGFFMGPPQPRPTLVYNRSPQSPVPSGFVRANESSSVKTLFVQMNVNVPEAWNDLRVMCVLLWGPLRGGSAPGDKGALPRSGECIYASRSRCEWMENRCALLREETELFMDAAITKMLRNMFP